MKKRLRLDLGTLILVLTALTALVMLISSFIASYRVQRQLLVDNSLNANLVYAAKLAASTDMFLHAAVQQLAYSAKLQGERFGDAGFLQQEADRLLGQTNSFNSAFVVDKNGVVQAISPSTLQLVGRTLSTVGAKEALRARKPTFSRPYISAANNLVAIATHPIVSRSGEYLGFIGGSFYLRKKSILNELLGEHFYNDGSYLYVVDSNRRLLYHPDPARIGTFVTNNLLVDRFPKERSGTQLVTNSRGVQMLAGFALVPTTHWTVVAQRPAERTIAELNSLLQKVILNTAPLALVSFALIWWLTRIIALPLRQLATSAKGMTESETAEHIRDVRVWYFEAAAIKSAMVLGLNLLHERIDKLNQDIQTDPLTALHNRRGLEVVLELWQAERRSFSAVMLDVDHFKSVNDTWGHETGDRVLIRLAELMRSCSRENDVLCRVGGEEFLMLLPGTAQSAATAVAERLRQTVQETAISPVGHITVSLGVATWTPQGPSTSEVIRRADEMLYAAKSAGRNCVKEHPPTHPSKLE